VTSDATVGVLRLTLKADIIVCTAQGPGVIKPVGFWGIANAGVPIPAVLSLQSNPNIANDMGAYDEVDYKITTESLTPRGTIIISPPLNYRFVRTGLQTHGCLP